MDLAGQLASAVGGKRKDRKKSKTKAKTKTKVKDMEAAQ
jgi:hypothetical protein